MYIIKHDATSTREDIGIVLEGQLQDLDSIALAVGHAVRLDVGSTTLII